MKDTIAVERSGNGITHMVGLVLRELRLIQQIRFLIKKGHRRFLIEFEDEQSVSVYTVGRPETARFPGVD